MSNQSQGFLDLLTKHHSEITIKAFCTYNHPAIVCFAQIPGERFQHHWSSGLITFSPFSPLMACILFTDVH